MASPAQRVSIAVMFRVQARLWQAREVPALRSRGEATYPSPSVGLQRCGVYAILSGIEVPFVVNAREFSGGDCLNGAWSVHARHAGGTRPRRPFLPDPGLFSARATAAVRVGA